MDPCRKEWNLEFFYLFLEACGYATDAAIATLMALEMYTYFEKEGKESFGNLAEVCPCAVKLAFQTH